MVPNVTISIISASLCLCASQAQVLVSDSLLISYTAAELLANGVAGAQFGVDVYRLRYQTPDANGNTSLASAALVVPVTDSCNLALACYMHGTIVEKEAVPSRLSGEILVGYYLGGAGYVAVLPDYLGLGDSPGMHPYVHAATEASASIDAMRATREFCDANDRMLNGQVFLAGYSQGGHACMATHWMIEAQFSDEFTVTASAPCSGPHDISGIQAEVITDTVPYPAPYYLPYVILAYEQLYPGLFTSYSEVFNAPYDTLLPPLYDGYHSSGEIDDVMPDVPSQVLRDSLLDVFANDPLHPFRIALQENDVYDWTPQAPVWMFYCEGDEHVFYQNSILAQQTMTANGATDVLASSMGVTLDHGGCAFPALLAVKNWFHTMKAPCTWNGVGEVPVIAVQIYPQPADQVLLVELPQAQLGRAIWSLRSISGVEVAGGPVLSGPFQIDAGDLASGSYVLHFSGERDNHARLVVVAH